MHFSIKAYFISHLLISNKMNFDIYDMAIKIHVNINIFIGNIVNTVYVHVRRN